MAFGVLAGQITVIFLEVLLGYVGARSGIIKDRDSKFLSDFIMKLLLPCTMLAGAAVDGEPELLTQAGVLFVLLLALFVVTTGLCRLSSWLHHDTPGKYAVLVGTAAMPNCGFIGLPLCSALLGTARGTVFAGMALDPSEFKSTWLGNKAVYRTRMAMADGGELLILAPGVERFGEDPEADRLIRKYGYRGRLAVLDAFRQPENQDLRDNMGAAAHLIHGSPDGRFTVTYAVRDISQEEIRSVHFGAASYEELARRYDPEKLRYGYNTVDGEEIFFVPNPALGLWIDRQRFRENP